MDRMDFAQAVTRIGVLETKLLSRATLNLLVDASDIRDVLNILQETEYGDLIEQLPRAEDYEQVLSAETKRLYEEMYKICPEAIVVDLLTLKYDYHNIKVLVKERVMEKDLGDIYIPIGTADFDKLKEAYLSGDLNRQDPRFRRALTETTEDFASRKDPQRIDLMLDRFYFEHLYEMAKETDIALFIDYVQDLIDFTNMRTLIRLRKQKKDIKFLEEALIPNGTISTDKILPAINSSLDMIIDNFKCYDIRFELMEGLLDYQKTGSLSEFEKQMDNYLTDLCRKSKYVTFGPEPIFAYIVAKEIEIKILRIIMVSKLNKLSPDTIRERLRDLYV